MTCIVLDLSTAHRGTAPALLFPLSVCGVCVCGGGGKLNR